jgi:hypothetical protein
LSRKLLTIVFTLHNISYSLERDGLIGNSDRKSATSRLNAVGDGEGVGVGAGAVVEVGHAGIIQIFLGEAANGRSV